MPDLARFTDFASRVGPVAPACSTCSTVASGQMLQDFRNNFIDVAPAAPVAPEIGDDAQGADLEERSFSAHVEALDLHCEFEVRAARYEFSAGMSRQEAEARAWKEVFGDKERAA